MYKFLRIQRLETTTISRFCQSNASISSSAILYFYLKNSSSCNYVKKLVKTLKLDTHNSINRGGITDKVILTFLKENLREEFSLKKLLAEYQEPAQKNEYFFIIWKVKNLLSSMKALIFEIFVIEKRQTDGRNSKTSSVLH